MNALHRCMISLVVLSAAAAHAQEGPQLNLQRTRLGVGMHQIDAQVAITPQQRAIGLMNRKEDRKSTRLNSSHH